MYPRERRNPASILAALGIWLLFILAVSSEETMHFRAAVGQQEDQQNVINYTESASNQTGNTGNLSSALVDTQQEPQTTENQKGVAALSANLSQSDFETLTQDLVEARQALENNDTTTLFDELNSASGELFQVISGQFELLQAQNVIIQ
jgi:S-formylglutathione hydrolase FrmB